MITSSSLEKLKLRREVLNARIQRIHALEITRERKRDMQRKMLIGTYMLEKAKKENTFAQLSKDMHAFFTKSSDRSLFNLSEEII